MTEVVAALIWNKDKFMICQRPAHKARALLWEFVGGKVEQGETKEQALIRECREEISAKPEIVRPLWLNQAFFTEDVSKIRFHELCIYFLMDISKTDILSRGEKFITKEGERENRFEWIPFEKLEEEYFYPNFLKKDIYNLPENFTIRTEIE